VDKQGEMYNDDKDKNNFNDRMLCLPEERLANAI